MGYAQYKELDNSGVTWLQKKPSHWRIKRLKFSTDLINNKVSVEDSPLPYLGLEHIESWTGRKIDGEISNSEGLASSFITGDVLFGKLRPYLAKVHLAQQDGLISSEALVVRSKDKLHAEFLKYYMLSRDFINIVDSSTYGSKMPRASWDFIGNLPVLLPEVEEQKAIARFLDFKTTQIDALIAKKKSLLNKLAEKRTALISNAVTKGLDPTVAMKDSGVAWLGNVPTHWKVIPIKFSLDTPITDGPHSTPQFYDDGIPFISAEAVKNDRLDFSRMRGYISEDDHAIFSKKYKPKFGDVYMVKSGATTGAVARVETHEDFNIWSPLAVLRPHEEKSITDYLFYVLKSKPFFYSVELSWSYGTQQNIGMGVISNIRMALPPVEEQQEICQYLEPLLQKIEDQREKINTVLDRLKEYRSTLITNAVTGKIDVRNFEMPQPTEGLAL
jgi:type I restriction enzyme S subunit